MSQIFPAMTKLNSNLHGKTMINQINLTFESEECGRTR